MISRKKRTRYRDSAIEIAKEHNIPLNTDSWEEIWNILDRFNEPTYVYCMKDEQNNYKFGKSVQPKTRLGSIQTGHPYTVSLVAYCLESEYLTEREIHDRLHHLRMRGEWFQDGEELQTVIREMYSHMATGIRG